MEFETENTGVTRSPPASIESLCQRFDQAWQAGCRPAIEEYLPLAVPAARLELLSALVSMDMHHRRRMGETPAIDDYARRFPADLVELRTRLSHVCDSVGGLTGTTVTYQSTSPAQGTMAGPPTVSGHEQLGRYLLRARLGQGGFGEVFRAHDPELARDVAIKVLRADRQIDDGAYARFVQEGRKLAQLRCPGIVRVFDVGRDHGRAFIVSELMPGGTLADRCREARFLPGEAAEMAARIAESLHLVHRQGIVHRDLKPQNVLLDDHGAPHIADFGLAVTEEDQLEEAGGTLGTYAYMSPEQLRGGSHLVDPRSDVYSLGVILYQMLTDRLPHVARTIDQWREHVLHGSPRPPRTIDDRVPAELERICLKCLAKDIDARYTTAQDLAVDLRNAVAGPKAAKRNRLPLVAVAAICFVLLVAIVLATTVGRWWGGHDSVNGYAAAVVPQRSSNGSTHTSGTGGQALDPDAQLQALAELDVVATPDGEWVKLLRQPPKVALWPLLHNNSSLLHDAGKQELQVTAQHIALIELGGTASPDLELQASIYQAAWEGRVGFYFGYQDDPERGPTHKRMQLLELDRRIQGGVPKTLLIRMLLTIEESGQVVRKEQIPITTMFSAPPQATTMRLRIKDGVIREARFGDEAGTEVPEALLPVLRRLDYQGRFGLYVDSATAIFRGVRVRTIPVSRGTTDAQR